MEQKKAIPQGYMTVGEVAKKMNVSVRTLQYYDKEGLFSPSAESEGGRRLYTDKDMIQLHQVLSLKHLGFSLGDIKNRLISLDTPDEVASVLSEQAEVVRDKIESLSRSLKDLEALKEEVLQMQSVNFKKYADIIVNLQMKNDFYWLIKHFDDKMLDHIRNHFDKESGLAFIKHFTKLQDKVLQYQKEQVPPECEKGQQLAKEFWKMIVEFTGGDMSMLPQLMDIGNMDDPNGEWQKKQIAVNAFMEPALEIYFRNMGINPFQEEQP